LADYQCDFALFLELFNAPLLGIDTHQNSIKSINAFSEYSEQTMEEISRLAVAYNISIIVGGNKLNVFDTDFGKKLVF